MRIIHFPDDRTSNCSLRGASSDKAYDKDVLKTPEEFRGLFIVVE